MNDPLEKAVDRAARKSEMDVLRTEIEQLRAALQGMLMEWDKLTKYGSPIAKAANERVTAARAALKDTKP